MSQLKVRSTSQRCGRTSNPLALSLHLTLPGLVGDRAAGGPAPSFRPMTGSTKGLGVSLGSALVSEKLSLKLS